MRVHSHVRATRVLITHPLSFSPLCVCVTVRACARPCSRFTKRGSLLQGSSRTLLARRATPTTTRAPTCPSTSTPRTTWCSHAQSWHQPWRLPCPTAKPSTAVLPTPRMPSPGEHVDISGKCHDCTFVDYDTGFRMPRVKHGSMYRTGNASGGDALMKCASIL